MLVPVPNKYTLFLTHPAPRCFYKNTLPCPYFFRYFYFPLFFYKCPWILVSLMFPWILHDIIKALYGSNAIWAWNYLVQMGLSININHTLFVQSSRGRFNPFLRGGRGGGLIWPDDYFGALLKNYKKKELIRCLPCDFSNVSLNTYDCVSIFQKTT